MIRMYLCGMAEVDVIEEDVWDDEEPEAEVTEVAEQPVERMRIVTEKRQVPLRIDKF